MVSREEFEAFKAGELATIEAIKKRLSIDAHHRGHSPEHQGEPIEPVGAARASLEKLDLSYLKPVKVKRAGRASNARARAGHGATPEQRSYAERARKEARR